LVMPETKGRELESISAELELTVDKP